MLIPECIKKLRPHKEGTDYVATYLGPWAHPRNEIVRAGGLDITRERTRLKRIREKVFAAYR